MKKDFSFEIILDLPYDDAIQLVTNSLKVEGFGVLTEIDVKSTMKVKLGEDFRPYAILGACNPPLAHKALSSVPEIGLLLPCNITVEATDCGGSIIRILDPRIMVSVGNLEKNKVLVEVANEAYQKLERVAKMLTENQGFVRQNERP
jgi:uncharacterized protein (DUF302 family)